MLTFIIFTISEFFEILSLQTTTTDTAAASTSAVVAIVVVVVAAAAAAAAATTAAAAAATFTLLLELLLLHIQVHVYVADFAYTTAEDHYLSDADRTFAVTKLQRIKSKAISE